MKRVLLTGATGFIGSHVARLLVREGCEVTALVRPGTDPRRIADVLPDIKLLEGDLIAPRKLEAPLRAAAPELCLHLGWYAVPGKYLRAPENVDCVAGSMELLRVLAEIGCRRVVALGTCFEYDTDVGYLAESSPIRPRFLYAACKHALFLMAEQFQRERGLSFAWPRIFYLYGPWEDERRLVPLVIRKLLAGEPCPLTPGEQIRDYLHVEDVAGAIWAVAGSGIEGPINIGSSRPTRVADVAWQIGELLGRAELLHIGDIPAPAGDPPFVCANTQRLRSETDWRPEYELRDGLEATIEWWRWHLSETTHARQQERNWKHW